MDRRHALPAGHMMQRVLLVGCGDVALRVAQRLRHRARLIGVTRNRDDARKLRAHGIVPLVGDLDDRRTLDRVRAATFAVLHFAPPSDGGMTRARETCWPR
jgi:saccharopine dehydrogenase-like NADP-dependent oxidoreductase